MTDPNDTPRFVPVSTYRLQVHAAFPLTAARDVVPYIASIGITACYTSPYFTAGPGSTHGYDVNDHNEVNPELGGRPALDAFTDALAAHGLGHVVDFVPNHMGIGTGRNARWNDLLENGPSSPAAAFFDVEWAPVREELYAKLLLPILGDQYGRVLERGELQVAFRDGQLVLRYGETELPLNPRQAPRVYRLAVEPLTEALGADSSALQEFQSIITSLQNLPPYTERRAEKMAERQREKDVAKARLAKLVAEAPVVGELIDAAIRTFNGEVGHPESFDPLHELLESQPYRLAYWRTASHEINYRRFFDVNTLAGLRVENPDVFAATHTLLEALLQEGRVSGVRVDHPDGLFDPARYFQMLQELAARARGDGDDAARSSRSLYVVAEKILSAGESLPESWAVHGTTGYNYLNDLNGLFVDATNARRLRRAYGKLTGRLEPFEDVLYASKRLIIETGLASELTVLAHFLHRIGQSNRRSRDFTLESLRDVITEVVACFPVYRTYVDEHGWNTHDRATVERAIVLARRRNPAMESSLFDFFREVMLARGPDDTAAPRPGDRRAGYPPADAAEARLRLQFAMKFQQYTGPVQAKGLEDTSFYRYNLLISMNEVGGDPTRVGRSVEEFHGANRQRLGAWPFEMIATSTHDTKLGEDVRARINVISEIPDDWSRGVSRWMRISKRHRTLVDGEPAPDRNDEYRFYQAMAGIWPAGETGLAEDERTALCERVQAYMLKAVREAKLHTSWLTLNEAYEAAVLQFVQRLLADEEFRSAFEPLRLRIAYAGMINSLAQVTLKIGSPGVPDFYQGTELWDLTLVDPDNRRAVDFGPRVQMLAELDTTFALPAADRRAAVAQLLEKWPDGRVKMLITAAGLRLRRDASELFLRGEYRALQTESTVDAEIVAFARIRGEHAAVFIAPRFAAPMTAGGRAPAGAENWKTSRILLPPELSGYVFESVLTGDEHRAAVTDSQHWLLAGQVLEVLPVAMLRARPDR